MNGKTSYWAPWIESLPTPAEFASFHPYYAEPDLMASFSALPLEADLEYDIARADEIWQEKKQQWIKLAQTSGAGAEGLTFEDFKWGCTVVWTRVYSGLVSGGKEHLGLVPINDLTNHAAGKTFNLDWSHRLTGSPPAWTMVACKDIRKGEEITESYGNKSNDALLWSFGFTMTANPVAAPLLSKEQCNRLQGPMAATSFDKSPQPQILRSLQALSREQCAYAGEQEGATFLKYFLQIKELLDAKRTVWATLQKIFQRNTSTHFET